MTTNNRTTTASAAAASSNSNDPQSAARQQPQQPTATKATTTKTTTSLPPISLRFEFYKRIQVVVEQKIDFLTTELQDRRPAVSLPLFSSQQQQQQRIPIHWTQPRKRQIAYYKTALLPAIAAALVLPPLPHHIIEEEEEENNDDIINNREQQESLLPTTTTTTSSDTTTTMTASAAATAAADDGTDGTTTPSDNTADVDDVYAVLTLVVGNLLLVSHQNYDARCRHVLKTAAVEWMVELQLLVSSLEKNQQQQETSCGKDDDDDDDQQQQSQSCQPEEQIMQKDSCKEDDDDRKTSTGSVAAAADRDNESDNIDNAKNRDSGADATTTITTTTVKNHRHPRTIYFLTELTDDDNKNKDAASEKKSGRKQKQDDDDQSENFVGEGDTTEQSTNENDNSSSRDNDDDSQEEEDNTKGQDIALSKQQEESESSQKKPKQEQQTPQTSSKSKKKTYKCTTTLFELDATDQAVRQFEAMEKSIAVDILKVLVERSNAQQQQEQQASQEQLLLDAQKQRRSRRMDLLKKSLQITAAGVLVGGLFAVTGGLAAPGLVAAITALGINSSAAAFAALTTTHALASMFGVLGGGLGVYKMSKRVQGLSEWRIRQETTTVVQQEETARSSPSNTSTSSDSSRATDTNDNAAARESTNRDKSNSNNKPEKNDEVNLHGLHAHVCVSGWLADKSDFQRPFGVQPNDPPSPPLDDLQRFFCVYAPERVGEAKDLLEEHQDDTANFGNELREQYGRDPGTLLPLQRAQEERILSTNTERTIYSILDNYVLEEECAEKMKQIYEANIMLMEMEARNEELMMSLSVTPTIVPDGEKPGDPTVSEAFDDSVSNGEDSESPKENDSDAKLAEGVGLTEMEGADSHGEWTESVLTRQPESTNESNEEQQQVLIERGDRAMVEQTDLEAVGNEELESEVKDEAAAPAHSQVIWDWQARYSGELYTVTWETDFLLNLCKVATVLFREIGDQISKQILTTALVGAAIAVPSALHTASSIIDDPYQLISLRSEKAGIELAHCLLSAEEHRPISLVGFSFGARVCFACLRELARHQLLWLEKQKQKEEAPSELPRKGVWARMRRKNSKIPEEDDFNYKREPASIVEDVVLIGMPRLISSREWINIREIVAGRIVNCYNPSDWIVSYMINIRCWNGVRKTCGTHPIVKVSGIENYEISSFAPSHGRYRLAVPQILQHVGYGQPKRQSLAASGKLR